MVHILLKASTDARRKALAESIHAARVRRRVVVGLIEGMVRRGHPAYRRVRMDAVRARAAAIRLPEDGRFPSLVVDFSVGTKPASAAEGDPLRPQKMATPADSRVPETEDPLRARRPSAIVEERSSILCEDSAAAKASALRSVVSRLRPTGVASTASATAEANTAPSVATEEAAASARGFDPELSFTHREKGFSATVSAARAREARVALDAVMAQGGYRAPDAARLLDYLDEQAR